MGEEIPRVQVMRGKKKPGTRYFGPYTHAWAIRETVDLLLRVFPVRSCSAGVLKRDRKSTRLNSSHVASSYAVFCLKKKMRWTHWFTEWTNARRDRARIN